MPGQRGIQQGAQPFRPGGDLGSVGSPDPAEQGDRNRGRRLLIDDDPQIYGCPEGRIRYPVQEAPLFLERLGQPLGPGQFPVLACLEQVHRGVHGDGEIGIGHRGPLAAGLQARRRSSGSNQSRHGRGR